MDFNCCLVEESILQWHLWDIWHTFKLQGLWKMYRLKRNIKLRPIFSLLSCFHQLIFNSFCVERNTCHDLTTLFTDGSNKPIPTRNNKFVHVFVFKHLLYHSVGKWTIKIMTEIVGVQDKCLLNIYCVNMNIYFKNLR